VKDFSGIVKLLTDNGLTDVSHLGVAAQSSLSRWSRPDDAQRATQDNTWDYAFHTGEDAEAWWSITFAKPQFLSLVIIENRRDVVYQGRAAELSVFCTVSGSERLLYRGTTEFGALPRQLPLILPADRKLPITSLRIVRNTPGALHLARVRILGDTSVLQRVSGRQPIFVAMNADGFGERLRAIMNAMLMARTFGGSFVFNWDPMHVPAEVLKTHSVTSREETFSSDFLEKYHIDGASLKEMQIREFTDLRPVETQEHRTGRPEGLQVWHQLNQFQTDKLRSMGVSPSSQYGQIFESISFSLHLERVKSLADAIDLPEDIVALHLRAGDVIYGPVRSLGRFAAKCFPFTLVNEFIKECQQAGKALLVFGQDEDLLKQLQKNYGLMLAQDYLDDFDATETALFEICLMSRCRSIFAGNSGFAHAASWRKGTSIRSLYSLFTPERARELTHKAILDPTSTDGVSDLQKAFACWAALYVRSDAIVRSQADRDLLGAARRYDPENDLYLLATAIMHYAEGKDAAAEDLLRTSFEKWMRLENSDTVMSVFGILRGTFTSGGHSSLPAKWIPELERAASDGHPMAACCMALIRKAEKKQSEAQSHLQILKASPSPSVQEILTYAEQKSWV
jgi:hypothetical protein